MLKNTRKGLITPLLAGGVFLAFFLFAPTMVSAGQYVYDGTPTFTVTYPDTMTTHPENPDNLPLRLGTDGSVPILEVNVRDIPEDMTLENSGERIHQGYVKSLGSADLKQNEMITLPCGTPANAVLVGFLFQGFFPLDSYVVSAIKDGKWVTVTVIQSDGMGMTEPADSLTFK